MRHPDGFYRYRINEEIFAFPDEKPQYQNSVILPTDAEFADFWEAEPMRQLRQQRDQLLSETDWWCCSDRTPTQAQLDYRTALRDLPANSTPSLDEKGQLTGVTWPNKPN